MSNIQTRSGLVVLRDNFMAALEVSPWANKDLVQHHLEEESELMIPIYAIRYDWHTKGLKNKILVFDVT